MATMTSDTDRRILSMQETNETVGKLLTVAGVSEELRVTRGTAYRWIREGSLPAVRVGGTHEPLRPTLLATPSAAKTPATKGEGRTD